MIGFFIFFLVGGGKIERGCIIVHVMYLVRSFHYVYVGTYDTFKYNTIANHTSYSVITSLCFYAP